MKKNPVDYDAIKKEIEKEFPEDPALQQVHIARKLLAREAELEGLSFIEYVRRQAKKSRSLLYPE